MSLNVRFTRNRVCMKIYTHIYSMWHEHAKAKAHVYVIYVNFWEIIIAFPNGGQWASFSKVCPPWLIPLVTPLLVTLEAKSLVKEKLLVIKNSQGKHIICRYTIDCTHHENWWSFLPTKLPSCFFDILSCRPRNSTTLLHVSAEFCFDLCFFFYCRKQCRINH